MKTNNYLFNRSIFSNPSLIFSLLWLLVLFLTQLKWSDLISPVPNELYYLILSTILSGIMMAIFCAIIVPNFLKKKQIQFVPEILSQRIKKLKFLWILISVFELIVAGNFPLLSLFNIGSFVRYTDYGISGIHGLANAIQLVVFIHYSYRYLTNKRIKDFLLLIFLLGFSIILASRFMFLIQLCSYIFVLLSIRKFSIKSLPLFISLFSLLVFFINYLGSARVNDGKYDIAGLAQLNSNYPEFLPDGFIWIYLYITTPLNNISFNYENFEPFYFPINNLIDILPNFLKNILEIKNPKPITLVNENLNVTSYLESFIGDYGLLMIIPVFFIMLIFSLNWSLSIGSLKKSYLNIIFCLMALFSFFVNTFSMLVLYFCIFLIFYLFRTKKIKIS